MTYAKNSNILASDFNTFAGSTSTAAASALAAQNVAGSLWGVGFGDRGYGQSLPALAAMVSGNPVGQEWQNLRTVLSNLASWQNTPTTLLPPSTSFNSLAAIVAHEQDTPSLNAYDIQNLLALLDTNRLNYQIANMSLTSNAASTTKNVTWGAGNSGITCSFRVNFGTENAARYFFNTGGQIRIALSHPDTSSPRNISWNTILSGLSVALSAHSTQRLSGSYGSNTSLGYYELTSANQTVYAGTNVGTGVYTTNDFIISAKGVNSSGAAPAGTNGAKGEVVDVTIVLTDEQTNAWSDIVAAGTVATVSILKGNTGITIANPSVSVLTSF